jgi:hypothetical protein
MNVSTRQLQAFLAVARLCSFKRAAEEIFFTQGGLNLMLKDLDATFQEVVHPALVWEAEVVEAFSKRITRTDEQPQASEIEAQRPSPAGQQSAAGRLDGGQCERGCRGQPAH